MCKSNFPKRMICVLLALCVMLHQNLYLVHAVFEAAAACRAEHDAQCQQHAYHSFREITFTHIVYSVCQCLGL